jgi:hypothetical protein
VDAEVRGFFRTLYGMDEDAVTRIVMSRVHLDVR